MNKKITLIIILFLAASVFLTANDRQDLYLKAVAEKDMTTKMNLLKQYVDQYGSKDDKFLRFIYLNLADTCFKLKNYDETIQYGETALGYTELDQNNKLRLYFSLANSYNLTRKDLDKAIQYTDLMVDVCKKLIEQSKSTVAEEDKQKQIEENYNNYYIAPAYRIQAKIYYDKGEISTAAEKALAAYTADKSEKSSNMAFALGVNLFQKNKFTESIGIVESVINKEKPSFQEANFLALAHYKAKNKDKAIEYYELAYNAKQKLDLAMRIGQLVQKTQPNKGLKYFADAYILSKENKEHQSYKYAEHIYFNIIAKNKPNAEKEQGFKEVLKAAKARFGSHTTEQAAPPTTDATE